MAWSMIIAEPIGEIVAIICICGRLVASHGRELAKELGWPEIIGGMAGAALGHYIAGAVTKLVINIPMGDAVGAAANITATSPATSLAHAIYEGFSQVLPSLDDGTLWQVISETFSSPEASEALQQYGDAVTVTKTDGYLPYTHNSEIRFSGFDHVENILDSQGFHPTCFPETAENIIQLYYGDVTGSYNTLSDQIIEYAKNNGLATFDGRTGEWLIPNDCHQEIFSAWGIPTELSDFNHENFKYYLDHQCPIQLGVDSAYFGNSASGPHSVTLVDLQQAADGNWYYRILDSANPSQQWYLASQVEESAQSALKKWGGINGRALICKASAPKWPFTK